MYLIPHTSRAPSFRPITLALAAATSLALSLLTLATPGAPASAGVRGPAGASASARVRGPAGASASAGVRGRARPPPRPALTGKPAPRAAHGSTRACPSRPGYSW